jgi:tetratricopeptide (TPR) repeat protein
VRTIAAIGARYLVMAATAHGVSAFHEPPASPSWADPWWLLALLLGALLLARLLFSLGRRREEAAWWICAAAAFVPVSQIFPFFYPMGDRYLYFILPGLIGGALLWGMDGSRRILAASGRPGLAALLGRSGLVAAALLIGFFGWKTTGRAEVWLDEEHALLDAARSYPEGSSAHYVRAVRAAQRRDVPLAVAELRAAEAVRHLSLVRSLAVDPRLAPLWGEPEFAAFVREIAGYRIELARRRGYDSPAWLRSLASAHAVRGEYDEAVDALERALRAGGPLRSELLADLERIEAARRRARAQEETSRSE